MFGHQLNPAFLQCLLPRAGSGGTSWTGVCGHSQAWSSSRSACPVAQLPTLETRRFHRSVCPDDKTRCLLCVKRQKGNLGARVMLQMTFKGGKRDPLGAFFKFRCFAMTLLLSLEELMTCFLFLFQAKNILIAYGTNTTLLQMWWRR